MTKAITPHSQSPSLSGQTIVVIGGSAGIGLATARRAHAEGAKVILAARNPEPLERAARELDALSIAAFDATDFALLEKFFGDLPFPVDHVLVTGPSSPCAGSIMCAQSLAWCIAWSTSLHHQVHTRYRPRVSRRYEGMRTVCRRT
jgi:D-arabinose 1-dehydrogenase-like Zn-dependent alcohol dehydrogenase